MPQTMGGPVAVEPEAGGGEAGGVFPTWQGQCQTLNPLMERILVVAYPELAGQLKAQQQLQGGK